MNPAQRENTNATWKSIRVAPGKFAYITDSRDMEAPLRPKPDISDYEKFCQFDEQNMRPNPDIWSVPDIHRLISSSGGQSTVKKLPTLPATINAKKDKGVDVHAETTPINDVHVKTECLQPGSVCIINTLRFKDSNLNERHGSLEDVALLQKVLSKFHMNVDCVTDASLNDVRSRMEKISKEDFENVSCLMVVIMSHGYEGNMIAAKDGTYSLSHDVMYPILQNKSLEPKLKIVVTQACKGPVNALHIQTDGRRPKVIPSEILQLYSCVEGYMSYLNTKRGSIFINVLCDNLKKHGFKKDILEIAHKVVADVKERYGDAQIPMVLTNVTKKYVFGDYVRSLECRKDQTDTSSSDDE